MPKPTMKKALLSLVDTINVTGGVLKHDNGLHSPAAEPDWIDLGEAYIEATRALGIRPKVKRQRGNVW